MFCKYIYENNTCTSHSFQHEKINLGLSLYQPDRYTTSSVFLLGLEKYKYIYLNNTDSAQ